MKTAALANLKKKIAAAQPVGSTRLFSMRHEFPSEWATFEGAAGGTIASLSFNLPPQHFPFWAGKLGLKLGATNGVSNGVEGIEIFAEMTNPNPVDFYEGSNTATPKKDSLKLDPSPGLMAGSLVNIALPPAIYPSGPPATPYTFYCDNNGMTDLWMAVPWPK